jgi:hypothetical protein
MSIQVHIGIPNNLVIDRNKVNLIEWLLYQYSNNNILANIYLSYTYD